MKFSFSYFLFVFSFFFSTLPVTAQVPNANESVKSYTGNFGYGSNMGVYGNGWNDKNLATIINKAGGNTIRPTLPEHFVERWGYPIRLAEFQYYTNELGMKDLTVFIEGPSEAHRDKTIYPGCTSSSKVFANLYEPIWKSDGTVNTNNYYANYVYKLVQTYGAYVRNWEVVNEPDIGANNPPEWLTRAPLPSEMANLRAPFFNYIRMLRITWEVVKKYNPDDFVTPGGIGHSNFLDALLRYTDNPSGGAVSSTYPAKGGAYFDMVSYHVYPTFYLRVWDNSIGGFKYLRNSDYAAAQVIGHKNGLDKVLTKYGYDGTTYPKKHIILTETNISRRTVDWRYSSDVMQRNFGIKSLVLAQKNNIKQYHLFGVAEHETAPTSETISSSAEYGLMGLYENLKRDTYGNEKLNQLGKGYKTTSMLLHGYKYDAAGTTALNLPAGVEGGAFKKDGEFVYVLWAKNPNDKSETYSQPYSFPAALNLAKVNRFEWDYSVTGSNTQQTPAGLTLNTAPSFFVPVVSSTTKQNQTITFNDISDKLAGSAPFTLQATASSGLTVSFRVVSGPATLSGSTLTLTGTGAVSVEATQSGNTTYNAATPVTQSFQVTSTTAITTSSNRYEAEKYTSMSGVSTETTTDTGGGLNVKSLDASNWMNYNVSVNSAGTYTLKFRIASSWGGSFEVKNSSGAVLKSVSLVKTGGFQTWTTISTTVPLNAGSQTIQIYVKGSGWNLNWFEIGSGTSIATTPVATTSGRIEAEKYTSMSGISTETTTDAGGGLNVKSLDANDWLKYTVSVSSAGTYTLRFRVASSWGGSFEVRNSSGAVLKTISVAKTGGFQTWSTISTSVPLNAGSQTIQIFVKGSGWNFNWLEIGSMTNLASAKSEFTEDLTAINNPGTDVISTVYPNPVITNATVEVRVPETIPATLEVLNMQGKVVRQLHAGTLEGNRLYQFNLEANGLAAGIYFTRLITPSKTHTQKIIIAQ